MNLRMSTEETTVLVKFIIQCSVVLFIPSREIYGRNIKLKKTDEMEVKI